jgi:hypothetical protein
MGSRTIDQWCQHRAVSRSSYYKMKKNGRAPDTIDSGGPRITDEADQRWREAREREAAEAAQRKAEDR